MKIIVIIIRRILGFPFFMGLSLLGSLFLWIKYMRNYVLHGGEAISYTHKNERKMIIDVYDKIQEKL